jgi:putative DNA primase/helicase
MTEPMTVIRGGAEAAPAKKAFQVSDIGNAERFVARHGENVRYVPAWGKWLLWDGKRWSTDETRGIYRLAKDVARAIWTDASDPARPKPERKALAQHALVSEREGKIRAMLECVKSEPGISITSDQLDTDPWLLACDNGTIDLRIGKLLPHTRDHLITKVVPAKYDLDAECPRWLAFLDRVLAGDQELIAFVQRAIGYSLTGVTTERALFFMYGFGRNGKSKFLEVVRALLSDYSRQADFTSFTERKGDGPRNDIARLFAARVVTSSEVGEGKRLDESLVKTLTGDETITARFLRAEFFEFRPQFKLWLAANHRPVIRGTDDGIWDRVRLIPFTVRITDEEKDDQLHEKLIAELDGILAWAVGGCVLWQRDGLGMPSAVRIATENYRRDSDTLGAFLDDCCTIGEESYSESATTLYETYARWCAQGGEHQVSQMRFGNALTERGLHAVKRHGKKWRVGIRLRADMLLPSPPRHLDPQRGLAV